MSSVLKSSPFLSRAVAVNDLRTPRAHVDVRRPVHGRIEFLRDEQLAVLAIQRVAETVAIEMHERLAHPAVDLEIDEHVLVDAVVVPLVVRRHLIHPLRHACVRVAREQGHAPAVVAGAHDGIPGAGIAAAVVDEIERGVVREPTPSRAAAEPPLLAFPGAQARVRADRPGRDASCAADRSSSSWSGPTL